VIWKHVRREFAVTRGLKVTTWISYTNALWSSATANDTPPVLRGLTFVANHSFHSGENNKTFYQEQIF
jgi:hypothetical protein